MTNASPKIYRKGLRRRKALVSFLVDPLYHQQKGVKFVKYSNEGIAAALVKVIRSLGYRVEVINWNDTSFAPNNQYDLVLIHGGANLKNLEPAIGNKTKVIYFATGCYWQFHNSAEKKRFRDFKKRHGVELPLDRYIGSSEEEANSKADGIICLGNSFTRSTFSKFKNVYNLNIGSYYDDHYENSSKDITSGRKNFLFFSGDGNVHKGLDLLLDIFSKQKDKHLYICTHLDEEFEEYYKDILYKSDNIHYMGYVIIKSEKYYELMDKCDFVVLPSCSEGSPGSVVDCMQHGLIPLVSHESGLDVKGYGRVLKTSSLTNLEKAINELSSAAESDLLVMSRNARRAALEDFSPAAFESNLKRYIKQIAESRV
jgi:glycosyltransferase involved in cell wall biosynthesis